MKPYYQDEYVTIYHGDSMELLPCITFDVVITDPPYGTGCAPRGGKTTGSIDLASAHIPEWDRFSLEWLALVDGVPLAVFCGQRTVYDVAKAARGDGLLIYAKSNPNPMGCSYEPCVTRGFPWPRGKQHVVAYNAANGQQHPTQKPLAVMNFVVGCAPDGTVVDPFAGSGTTGRAAKDLGRKAVLIEREERYCEIGARRMGQGVLDFGTANAGGEH